MHDVVRSGNISTNSTDNYVRFKTGNIETKYQDQKDY